MWFYIGFERDSVFGYVPCNSNRYVWDGVAYVRIAFQTWIPTIIVFTFNCLMFWKLRRIKLLRKRLTGTNSMAKKVIPFFKLFYFILKENLGHLRPANPGPLHRKRSFITKPSPTNPMLIAVSLAYLILVCPLGAVQSAELYWNFHGLFDPTVDHDDYIFWRKRKLLLKYVRSFFFGFYQLNFAINFFLYFAAGVEFRRHLNKKFVQFFSSSCCKKGSKQELQSCASNATNTTNVSAAALPVPPSTEARQRHPPPPDVESVV